MNELYHHGRLGQKWGVTNGPPYPLSRSTVSQEYGRKKKRGLLSSLRSRKEKKNNNPEEERSRYEANKQRVLREGSARDILPYINELSTNDINNAVNRLKAINELQKLSDAEFKKESERGWNTVNSVMKKVGNVKDWTKTGVELWENIDKAMKLWEKGQKRK